jgi:hypothetical protein
MGKRKDEKKQKKKNAAEAPNAFAENARAAAELKRVADREKLHERVALIDRRLINVRESFYDIGTALREIRDGQLYEQAEPEVDDFDAFLARRAWFSRSYAYELIEIATVYERETALMLKTVAMAHELVRYAVRKTGKKQDAQRIAASGEIEGQPLHALQAEDVRALGKKKKAKKSKVEHDAAELAARREARELDDWLAERGLPGAVARAAEEDGEWVVQVTVPVAVLARFRARRNAA